MTLPMPRWWGSTGTGVLPFAHDAVYFNDEMMSQSLRAKIDFVHTESE